MYLQKQKIKRDLMKNKNQLNIKHLIIAQKFLSAGIYFKLFRKLFLIDHVFVNGY